jgi:hypothetical protein
MRPPPDQNNVSENKNKATQRCNTRIYLSIDRSVLSQCHTISHYLPETGRYLFPLKSFGFQLSIRSTRERLSAARLRKEPPSFKTVSSPPWQCWARNRKLTNVIAIHEFLDSVYKGPWWPPFPSPSQDFSSNTFGLSQWKHHSKPAIQQENHYALHHRSQRLDGIAPCSHERRCPRARGQYQHQSPSKSISHLTLVR